MSVSLSEPDKFKSEIVEYIKQKRKGLQEFCEIMKKRVQCDIELECDYCRIGELLNVIDYPDYDEEELIKLLRDKIEQEKAATKGEGTEPGCYGRYDTCEVDYRHCNKCPEKGRCLLKSAQKRNWGKKGT